MGKPLKPLDDLGRELSAALEPELRQRGTLEAARQRFLLDTPQGREEMLARMGQAVDEAHQSELQQRLDLARVRTRLLSRPEGARTSRRLGWAVALSAGAAAAVLLVVLLVPGQPLTFTVGGKTGQVGQWLSVDGAGAPVEMRFSDGSNLRLAPGTNSRVIRLTQRGAQVGLEQGSLEVNVIPGGDKRWMLVVGPFSVQVIGTRFQVSWDQSDKHFSIRMRKGKVKVRGPTVGERELVKGESVEVWVEARRMVLTGEGAQSMASAAAAPRATETPQPPAPAAAAPANDEPLAPASAAGPVTVKSESSRGDRAPRSPARRTHSRPARPAVARASPPPASSEAAAVSAARPVDRAAPTPAVGQAAAEPGVPRDEPPPSPVAEKKATPALPDPGELAERGQYRQALEAARARGWDQLINSASAGQLAALATAARSEGETRRAVKLLESIRRRFPASSQAAYATFTLGTIAVHQLKDHRAAAAWFSRYLEQWPGGALAREALGRQVESLHRAGKLPEACAAARRYLAAHPGGPHIRYVRRVLITCGPHKTPAAPGTRD